DNGGYLFWIAVAVLSLRYRAPIQGWLDRRFFREQLDREQVLVELLDEVGKLESISELSRLVTNRLDSALHPRTIYVWYRDPAELEAAASADPLLTPTDLPTEGRWLDWLEARGGGVALPVLSDGAFTREETRWFAEREVSLIVPIAESGGRVVGALLVGERRSEEPYGANDRRLLLAVAKQAAVVRENLRLRARVSEEHRMRHDVLARLEARVPGVLKECPSCGTCFDGEAEQCPADRRPLVLSLPVARTVDARYRLERLIGKGGMGAVYEARDLRLQRAVAVKILLGRAFGQPAALRRFRREAHAAARLNHPCVVGIYDFGTLEGQGAYLVMERVSGTTLRAELDRVGVLAPAVVTAWFDPLLDGLAAAHAHGIVHRDLKPENVIGRTDGPRGLAVKILDFGLAKFAGAEPPASGTVTVEGSVLGTLGYMSPEQLRGGPVDHRTDVFAVGVMLVEALTGSRPFEGQSYAERATRHGAPSLPDSPLRAPAVDALLRRCLAADPRDRYESAGALRGDLVTTLPSGMGRSSRADG
ncbi:MAG TPA: protein kinase, partial [Vicinamibacteria bacterium]